MNYSEKATELHGEGYNCAQSVLGACCGDCGIDERTALALGTGFGRGLDCGELCGAVSGSVMAISAAINGADPGDNESTARAKAARDEFLDEIKSRYGAITCRELKAPGSAVPCGTIIAGCADLTGKIINNK